MEIVLVRRGLDFTRRNKKWIILLGLIGCSSYGMYKVYHMPSVVRKRMRIVKLFGAIISIAEMVSESSETISVLSKDFKEFLESDSDEIPTSLKQLSKIAQSKEFLESLTRVSQAMTIGILRGYRVGSSSSEIQELGNSSYSDRVMDKLMSTTGTGFISNIVGSFARNLVTGFYANGKSVEGLNENDDLGMSHVNSNLSGLPKWVDVVSDDKCRMLIANCIKTFVSTAVTVYLDKTMDVNFYDEMFSGLTNPNHRNKVVNGQQPYCSCVAAYSRGNYIAAPFYDPTQRDIRVGSSSAQLFKMGLGPSLELSLKSVIRDRERGGLEWAVAQPQPNS
ncbi:protein PHLOEM PROTEIN 2-LIKE A10-like [Olea europaea var. sylvestris]|uniref:protein PHLOEM PROTEIN 2-LIKE A10-like n=1 Tax=Olea europaea var. sylvestris TaxID=158386 RepID=UPI000C1D85EC|nr:protein PHLOEM PROTEIN 2-LIKE A10-like [Olea europaea var. sylvestris]